MYYRIIVESQYEVRADSVEEAQEKYNNNEATFRREDVLDVVEG